MLFIFTPPDLRVRNEKRPSWEIAKKAFGELKILDVQLMCFSDFSFQKMKSRFGEGSFRVGVFGQKIGLVEFFKRTAKKFRFFLGLAVLSCFLAGFG